ncbi:PP2C family serine/threonine-protein phosphatase [Streptomyces sp. NPDC050610]|uniref:PP2C family serine/threonine-protein phosphatase n=1 Tax=Streptomyces sp. NPDC050610 TaxID=3157097 RepID=UPI0034440216
MSQMPQLPQLAVCPQCAEPLEAGDNFCGGCGADLSAGAPAAGAPPAAPSNGAAHGGQGPGPYGQGSYGQDAYGQGSYGQDVYAQAPSAGAPSARASEDYPLAAPAADASAAPGGGAEIGPAAANGDAGTGRPHGQAAAAGPAGGGMSDPREGVMVGVPRGRRCGACRAGVIGEDGYCERCGHSQPRERDHMEEELADVAAVSDRGLRHHRNEDAFALSAATLADGAPAVVAVVCDGVSSATRPDEASAAASVAARAALTEALPLGAHPQQAMHDALLAAAESVGALAEPVNQPREHDEHRHQNAPACTIVSAVVGAGVLTVGWIGDSRVYWVPDDRATRAARLTEDDSWAEQMVANGLMSQAEAYADDRAHAITGWLGADAYELEPHTASFTPDRPGVVVVCTDGLWNYAESAEQMAAAVPLDARARPLHSARFLVGHALDGGGHDNVTVAILPFPGPPQGAGSA